MTGRLDPERILDAFLAPEADRLPDRVIDAALDAVARTPQRLALRVPWRFSLMPAIARSTGFAAVVLVAVIGAGAILYANWAAPAAPGTPAPATPGPTASPLEACAHELIPSLLMTVGCPYGSSQFVHPLTVTPPAGWLVGEVGPNVVTFRGYDPAVQYVEVNIIALGSLDGGGCLGSESPAPSSPPDLTSAGYIAWLRTTVPGISAPVASTFGGLPATLLVAPAPDPACQAITLGSTGEMPGGSVYSLSCIADPCSVYVIGDGARVLVAATTVGSDLPSGQAGLDSFLESLQLAP